MAINFNNGLIGLSLLSGSSSLSSAIQAGTGESAAVIAAKKAFTLPTVTPPWNDEPSNAPISTQIAALKRLATLVEQTKDNSLEDLPDVQTAFTAYKALDKMRLLAEYAAKTTTSSSERAALDKIFAKGLTDLQTYLGKADTSLLTLNFGQATRRADSVGVQIANSNGAVKGDGISANRDAPLAGVSGTEVFKIVLTRGTLTETVLVDLSASPQPPTLDSVAGALNAAISAGLAVDSNGQPVLDAEGNPTSKWKSNFTVEKHDGEWGLVFNAAGIEKASIDQVGSEDALMIASGRTSAEGPKSAQIFRIDNPQDSLAAERLSTINAIDTVATAKAQAAAKAAAAASKDKSVTEDKVQHVVYAPTEARGIATDAQGFSYIVGTSNGDYGSTLSDGLNDLYLTKVNSEGQTVWMRSLGAAGTGDGVGVTIAPNGSVVVAGTVSGAFSGGDDSQTDMLVARFDANGNQQFATSIRQVGDQSATALTLGNDGSIYVAGSSGNANKDAVIVRLDASGKVQEKHILDGAGTQAISALAIDNDGNLLALTRQDDQASLTRFDAQNLASQISTVSLGAVEARALAVSDSGEIAIVGATTNAAQGTQINTLSGGRDAFLIRVDATTGAMATTYIGTDSNDQADSVAYMNGALYVGGRTGGALEGNKTGKVDGFVARIDTASGQVADIDQWGLVAHTAEPVKIAAVTGGSTALGALGLARGSLNKTVSATLSSQTTLKEGDKFSLSVNDGTSRTITIAKDETMATLAQKIQRIVGKNGTATTARVDGKQVLRIQATTGNSIELMPGAEGKDALAKIGIAPVRLVATPPPAANAPKVTPGGVYSLNLTTSISLQDTKAATAALGQISAALSMSQSAYRSLYWDSAKAAKVDGAVTAVGSAYQNSRLAQYQAALARLSS